MSSVEGDPSSRVSFSPISHEVRNGGNTSPNRILLTDHIQSSVNVDPDVLAALEDGWRRGGEVPHEELDTVKLAKMKQRVRDAELATEKLLHTRKAA